MKTFFYALPIQLRQIWSGVKLIKQINLSTLRKVFSLMGKKEKTLFLGLLVVASLGLLWSLRNFYYSITLPAPGRGGSYTEGFVGQPNYINPVLAYQENDLSLVRLVFSGLYKYNGQGNLVPDLAEALPQVSEDQKQYTVALKKNVEWHNGRSFNADDVIFTISTIKDPDFKSPLRNAWASTNAEKLDDYTVKFTTKEVSGPFLHNLSLPILPESGWARVQAANFPLSELNLKAVGTGPYAIKEIKKLSSGKIQSISLESFSNFYFGKPNLDEIVIKFYDSEKDLINALHSREIMGFGYLPLDKGLYLDPKRENINIFSLALPQFQALFFNYSNEYLKQQNVRSALEKVISREALVNQIFSGNAKPIDSPFSFYLKNGDSSSLGPETKTATVLLLDAGFKKNADNGQWSKNNKPLSLRLFTNDMPANARAAEALAKTFRDFGLEISLNILPSKQLNENNIKPRDFDMLLLGQKFGADPDPFAFWHSSQIKDPGLNLSGFQDAQADKLLTSARTTTDQNIRQEKYAQLAKLLQTQVPAAFLTQTVYTYALDKEIKGVSLTKLFDPANRFYDAANWYIMERRVFK